VKQDEISLPVYLVIVQKVVKQMIQKGIQVKGSRVLVMGNREKEEYKSLSLGNVINLCVELQSYGIEVHAYLGSGTATILEQHGIAIVHHLADLQKRRLLSRDFRLPLTKACFDGVIWSSEKQIEIISCLTTPSVEFEW
jgi:hypothetical protein